MKTGKLLWAVIAACGLLLPSGQAQDQSPDMQDGSEIYTTRCAACHEMPVTDTAHPARDDRYLDLRLSGLEYPRTFA